MALGSEPVGERAGGAGCRTVGGTDVFKDRARPPSLWLVLQLELVNC